MMQRPDFPLKRNAWLLVAAVSLFTCHGLHAQQAPADSVGRVTVRGAFVEDSLRIGDPARYYLTATYPKNIDVLFPDSAESYAPFEFTNKKYFPTRTRDGVSYDSVVYYVSTFDIASVQRMSLPVYRINQQDCTVFRSPVDSIRLQPVVTFGVDTIALDNLPLKSTAEFYAVSTKFNPMIPILIVWTLTVLVAFVWGAFGKDLKRRMRLKRLKKAHAQFVETYSQQVASLQASFTPHGAESAVAQWKLYMERLESKPFTKLTTKEARKLVQDENLIRSLQAVDKAIYGHSTTIGEPLETLKRYADERFGKKMQEVMHG